MGLRVSPVARFLRPHRVRFALRASEIRTGVRVILPLRGSDIEGRLPFSAGPITANLYVLHRLIKNSLSSVRKKGCCCKMPVGALLFVQYLVRNLHDISARLGEQGEFHGCKGGVNGIQTRVFDVDILHGLTVVGGNLLFCRA